ncbi:MAG: extracellular solute-binding protein, partial [Defluviitaleaceae bacterium]|nr:extracellular solute-binding protein [Defluviitaleaceae bacterium]
MKRRYLMVLLCVALLAALFAGCAASPSPTASPSASPSAEPSASPSPTESPAPEAVAPAAIPLATPVTLNIFAYVDQNTTNPDYNNMDFWKQVEQATGINLNFTCFQGSAADLATKLNLLMAGGQYPDIVLMDLNAAQNVETYGVQQGIYIPLDPYLNATSMPNYYGVLSQTAFGAGPLVCSDGHVYSFGKMVDNGIKQFGKLYMNTKLLEAKGITPPDPNTMTWDQFNQTLQAVAALNDPSITPLSCTYGDPYVGAELLCGLWGGQMCYAGATGNPSGYAIDDNGKIYDCAATDQYRAFLTWLNSAYTGGLIDKEFLTQDNNTYYAKLTAGTSAFVLMNRTLNMAYSYDGIDKDYTQVMLTNMGVNPGAAPVWYTSTGGVPMQQGVSITIADK